MISRVLRARVELDFGADCCEQQPTVTTPSSARRGPSPFSPLPATVATRPKNARPSNGTFDQPCADRRRVRTTYFDASLPDRGAPCVDRNRIGVDARNICCTLGRASLIRLGVLDRSARDCKFFHVVFCYSNVFQSLEALRSNRTFQK